MEAALGPEACSNNSNWHSLLHKNVDLWYDCNLQNISGSSDHWFLLRLTRGRSRCWQSRSGVLVASFEAQPILIHAMADQNWLPRLDDTHFFFAHISCTQTYGSRGPNVWFTQFYSSIAAFFGGSFNRLMVGLPEHLCLVKLFSKALQMLQQLSILHQEDENERVQSLAAKDGSNESWIWRKPIEAKDDIEAMTLFKMAKVGILSPGPSKKMIGLHPAFWRDLMQAKADKDEAENEDSKPSDWWFFVSIFRWFFPHLMAGHRKRVISRQWWRCITDCITQNFPCFSFCDDLSTCRKTKEICCEVKIKLKPMPCWGWMRMVTWKCHDSFVRLWHIDIFDRCDMIFTKLFGPSSFVMQDGTTNDDRDALGFR